MVSSRSLLGLAVVLASLATGCAQKPNTAVALYGNCVSCHGADGAGNQTLGAPPIAGLPQWYVEAQLTKFKAGYRGYHGDDVNGLKMRPMTLSLANEEEIKKVSEYVAAMPAVASAATVTDGNASAGQSRYAVCASCHGADAKGNEAVKAPPLNGSADWYMLRQLQNFKAGIRGAHQQDVTGAQMRAIIGTLPDDQAMKDVVAYIQTL